ncbi:MAG: HAD family hydrolase [Ruminococcus sp.]|nr:HAD family hydrolase [Ruminococcus sp.]
MTNLIFDYDGTLHNCLKIYKPAFLKAYDWLVENGYAEPRTFSDYEIGYWLGFSGNDMWTMFQPKLPQDKRDICREIIGNEMGALCDAGEAELFSGAEEALALLKEKGHTLIFLSNCRVKYQQRHNEMFRLDRFFDHFYCAEAYDFIPKYEIFRRFRSQHNGNFIVIGDRFHDMETASKNGLKAIGCAYGYGNAEELKAADMIVNSVTEIPSAVELLSRTFSTKG